MDEKKATDKPVTRRQLLTSMGAAGLFLAAGAGWSGTAQAADTTVTAPKADAGGRFNVKDFGARGNGRYDQDDAPYFQMAIEAAAFAGGTVVVPAGKYMLNTGVALRSKVRIIGDGKATVLKSMQQYVSLLYGDQVNDVEIRDLSFEGSGSLNNGKWPKVERGIDLTKCTGVRVSGCRFTMIVNGIQLTECAYGEITGSVFTQLLSSDSAYEGNAIVAASGAHHRIANNQFQGLVKPCIHLSGGCSYTTIQGNVAEACEDAVISLASKLTACAHNQITGNTVSGYGLDEQKSSCQYGIRLKDLCTDNQISGNLIVRASAAGIALLGDGGAGDDRPYGNLVDGNQVSDSPVGVRLLNTDGNVVRGNDVRRGNTGILLETSGQKDASVCRSNTIAGNTLYRCAAAGIRLDSAACQDNAVYGNGGAGNGEALQDEGTETVKSGF